MFDLKILKFLFKLYHNELPPYFNNYRVHLEKHIVPYTLRLHALPVPAVAHVYAESSLVYKLVVMKNRIAVSDKLILKRLDDQDFSLIGFNHLVINGILSNYSYTYVPCKYATFVVASDIIFIYIIKPYFRTSCVF